ncbi:hypothetical protein HDV63DRAFT_156160 [Trichoderma sp. SZMC 28014]
MKHGYGSTRQSEAHTSAFTSAALTSVQVGTTSIWSRPSYLSRMTHPPGGKQSSPGSIRPLCALFACCSRGKETTFSYCVGRLSCYCKYPVHSPRRAIITGHTTPHLLTPGPRARIKSCVAHLSDILETERAGCANEIGDCAQVLQNSSSA